MDGLLKILQTIIDGGKRSIDFLAFALIAIVGAYAMTADVELLNVLAFVSTLLILWVASRWALFKLQERETLNKLRSDANVKATELLEKHATNEEVREFLKELSEDSQ